ncbi:MAG: membrane protein insertion efficiency factor YidD [Victivallales bacterium]|nr:membrane protein insertion efficiency factor YidD [Victivallales bacterium]
MLFAIRIYQKIVSPWLPPVCRFTPTCSHYAVEAIKRYGAWRGGWLTVWRLLRCQPFCKGGYDPVPELPRSRRGCGK